MTNNYFDQFSSLFNQGAAPQVDLNQASELFQKSLESAAKVNQIWIDSAQKIAKQQAEFIQDQAQQAANAASQALNAKSPEENVERGTKFAQSSLDANVQNAQNLAKSASETSAEIFDILNKQTAQNIDEISKTAKSAAKSAKKAS